MIKRDRFAGCGVWRRLVVTPGLAAALAVSVPSASSATPGIDAQLGDVATTPGEIVPESTYLCIGFKWYIEGDINQNCTVTVQFRPVDEAEWRAGLPFLRVEPGSHNQYEVDPGNLLAGSIFNLEQNTEYVVRLTLLDPDGGDAVEIRNVRTRSVPFDPASPNLRYVVPGDGGGTGTREDPFLGLAVANANAQPGDVFQIGEGTYPGPIVLSANGTEDNPIVWRGEDGAAVVFDGEGIAQPVLWVGALRYVHIENVLITRPRSVGVSGPGSVGLVIRSCVIDLSELQESRDHLGIDLRGTVATENALITGNVIEGPLDWTDGRNSDHYGVLVNGQGNVVCYNEIFNWYDAILIAGSTAQIVVETTGCDVYGNEIYNCTDDGIEIDRSRHNVRVFENRFTNVLVAMSCQPVFGGPVYMIRNVAYNWQLKPLKYHVEPTGMIAYHNTFVGADPRGFGGGDWRVAIHRNNIFVGASDAGHGESGGPIPIRTLGLFADWDYDGYYEAIPTRFADWNGDFYQSREAFTAGTGLEAHAVLLDLSAFVDAEEPEVGSYLGEQGFPEPYEPERADLRLAGGSVAADAGEVLPTINDDYLGDSPDLGAYERGIPIPLYGPGSQVVPILLSHFRAERTGRHALVVWGVSQAVAHAGFHLHRECCGGSRERVTTQLLHGRTNYEFVDHHVSPGLITYWLEEVGTSGESSWHGPVALPVVAPLPPVANGLRVYPNPMNSRSTFRYDLTGPASVRLAIFDARGRLAKLLLDRHQSPGVHSVTWDGRNRAGAPAGTGIYFARLEVNGVAETRKVVISE